MPSMPPRLELLLPLKSTMRRLTSEPFGILKCLARFLLPIVAIRLNVRGMCRQLGPTLPSIRPTCPMQAVSEQLQSMRGRRPTNRLSPLTNRIILAASMLCGLPSLTVT